MKIRSLTTWSIALGSTLLSGACLAGPAQADVSATLQKTLEARYPDVKVIDVQPAPVAGLFEVFTGDTIVYADASGDHLFVGSLMDTKTQRDLTLERVDARNTIDFGALPFASAIKTVKGDGRRRLAVFSDPDCPYCKRLEKELATLTDTTIYTFLFPISELHPDAVPKSRAIWCAPDPDQAWIQWMNEGKPPPLKTGCKEDPIDELQALGHKLRVGSTPTLYFADGRRVVGSKPAAELDALLNESSAAAPTSDSAGTPNRPGGNSPRPNR
jgi:thiol:disulfide interchange protein DsbC